MCQFFALDNALQELRCIDPTATDFGLLPKTWGLPLSLRRSAIQFDAAGNVYYRWLPKGTKDYENCEDGEVHPAAQIRRWDRVTDLVTTYPVGQFLPWRFQVVNDGSILVSGFDLTEPGPSPWPVLRYILPNGTWYQLVMEELGKADLPFLVVDGQTVLVPSTGAMGLYSVAFGPAGFGDVKPRVTADNNLVDAEGHLHWGLALHAALRFGKQLYTLDSGRPTDGAWWAGRNGLMRVAPGKPVLATTKVGDLEFFQVVDPHALARGTTEPHASRHAGDSPTPKGVVLSSHSRTCGVEGGTQQALPVGGATRAPIIDDQLYLVGKDVSGKYALVRVLGASPKGGMDLLGDANIRVDNLLVRRHELFFSGYEYGSSGAKSGYRLGRIDLLSDPLGPKGPVILSEPTSSPLVYPYGSTGGTE